MTTRRVFPLVGVLLLSGCLYHVREQTDQTAIDMAAHPFDRAPASGSSSATPDSTLPKPKELPDGMLPKPKEMPEEKAGTLGKGSKPQPDIDVQTTAYLQRKEGASAAEILPPQLDIPERIPGSEAKRIELPLERAKAAAELRRLYPPLPALPEYPRAALSPEGTPYTLAALQHLAVLNSPAIREAAADVETARGNMLQASMYPNPNFGWQSDPSNNGSTAAVFGVYFEQIIKTAGKLKLATAAAEKNLENAELALKRARSDLATAVRTAYFNLLVARETVEVNRALAQFTDEIYRLQSTLVQSVGLYASYEPAALRASAYTARLAYRQSIETYIYDWKQLAAAIGCRDLPLTEVAGHVDQLIPRYDYYKVLAHVLEHHTDILTAKNAIEMQKYNLKLAQVAPISDVDVRFTVEKETALAPFNWYSGLTFGIVLPVWDQNRGAIRAAEGTLSHALQEPKRVELTIANGLAGAFASYRTNLDALQAYRKEILPDAVRFYRGVYERRRLDPNAAFGDLVSAQTALTGNVTTYLTTLAAMWTAVVSLADYLQTDDLFQMGPPEPLPPVPQLHLPPFNVPGTNGPPAGSVPGSCIPPPAVDRGATLPKLPDPQSLPAISTGTSSLPPVGTK